MRGSSRGEKAPKCENAKMRQCHTLTITSVFMSRTDIITSVSKCINLVHGPNLVHVGIALSL